ncbi:MAG TPA: hypothetical protein VHB20_10550 [Verrucomicrobiae bacterium]|jgi:hypothetical protein|nr:hypothetical protein [Verrucomicrobiae bacterium]
MAFSVSKWGKNAVKIIGVITFALGIYVLAHMLAPSLKAPALEFIVANPPLRPDGCLDFYSSSNPNDHATVTLNFPRSFRLAAPGDRLQMSTPMDSGYWRLLRHGRVIAWKLSDEQLHTILFIAASLFPALVFFPCKNRLLRSLIFGGAICVEAIVIGIALFAASFIWALASSHSC